MEKFTTCLWFDGKAEEAANYYAGIFKDTKIGKKLFYLDGSVVTIEFELNGMKFLGLNGGPQFKFNESVSFVIHCDTQEEVDYYWYKLTADGGEESMCSWLKDKYGLSWQVVPKILIALLGDADRDKANRVMEAMMQMRKIDIAKIKEAAEG